jgi:hypothetical protein
VARTWHGTSTRRCTIKLNIYEVLVVPFLSFNSHFSSAIFIAGIPYEQQNTAENKTIQTEISTRSYTVTNSKNYGRTVACKALPAAELTQSTRYEELNMLGKYLLI